MEDVLMTHVPRVACRVSCVILRPRFRAARPLARRLPRVARHHSTSFKAFSSSPISFSSAAISPMTFSLGSHSWYL